MDISDTPTAARCDMRPAAIDDPTDTRGPAWIANTCALDSVLYTAKVIGLAQNRCDHDIESSSAAQEESWQLLRKAWWQIGAKAVNASRTKIAGLWAEATGVGVESFRALDDAWDLVAVGLPSAAVKTSMVTLCDTCDEETGRGVVVNCALNTGIGEVKQRLGPDAHLGALLEAIFKTFYQGKECDACRKREVRQLRVNGLLPELLLVSHLPDTMAIHLDRDVNFRCYSTDLVAKRYVYRIDAVLIYNPVEKHFTALLVQHQADAQNDIYFDGMKGRGRPRRVPRKESEEIMRKGIVRLVLRLIWCDGQEKLSPSRGESA